MVNPYERRDPLSTGLRAFQTVRQLQRDDQQAQYQAEDRAYMAQQRQRQAVLDARADADYEANRPVVEATRRETMADLEQRPSLRAYEAKRRSDEEASRMTPEQAQQSNQARADASQLAVQQGKLGLEQTRLSIAKLNEDLANTKADRAASSAALKDYETLVEKFDSLMSPDTANSVMDFYQAAHEGNGQKLEQLWPNVLQSVNSLYRSELMEGVGEKLPNGDVIADKSLKDFHIEQGADGKDYAILELNVIAKNKDGKERVYQAPATKGRKAWDGNAENFIRIPMQDDGSGHSLESLLSGAAASALEVHQQPADVKRQIAEVTRRRLAAANVPKDKIDALLGTAGADTAGAMGKDLDYLSRNYTGGDKDKAVELYKSLRSAAAKPKNERFELVKALMQATGRQPNQKEVDELMKISGASAGGVGSDEPAADSAEGAEDFSSLWGAQ
jgi:hypothetical protein